PLHSGLVQVFTSGSRNGISPRRFASRLKSEIRSTKSERRSAEGGLLSDFVLRISAFSTRRCFGRHAALTGAWSHWVSPCFRRRVEDAQELFLVEDHLLAGEAGEVVEGGEFDRVHRAGFLAHPAIDAAQLIDDERLGIL